MDNKITLRSKAKEIRKTLNIPRKSKLAVQLIREDVIYRSAKNVMLYYPAKDELNLSELFNDDKNFYLPKVEGEYLSVCPYDKQCRLEKSCFNIFEPCSAPVNPKILDLIIVPALMADKKNYRLGYGGGFYDRFLEDVKIKTVCIIPKELYIDALPVEKFDIKIDKIIQV